jgi:thymidylate synthase (FAD)
MITATYIDHMGTDLTVVNAARVSFGKKSEMEEEHGVWKLKDGDVKLIKYLATGMQSKDLAEWLAQMVNSTDYDTVLEAYQALTEAEPHKSPFGHCFASVHVKAPVFVARQLVKHKFLRWSEVSRRYVDSEPEFYVPTVWRGRSADKKQGSEGIVELNEAISGMYRWHMEGMLDLYKEFLDQEVAPEMARMVLPQSMMTEWWWSGSLDAFADMCNLRCKGDAQYESRLVADQIDTIMLGLYPVSWGALRND